MPTLRIILRSMLIVACLVAPTSTDASGMPSGSLVQQRLEVLEARMKAFEATFGTKGGSLAVTHDPDTEEAAVAEQLASLELRMAALERTAIATSQESRGVSSVSADLVKQESVAVMAGPSEPTVTNLKSLFLPSRGYAGGAFHYGGDEQRIELHAFLDLEYIDSGPEGSRSGVSTFDNHHTNLFIRSVLRPNLLGHIEIEYEHGGDTVEIDQAYLDWAPTGWLSLRAGRFYTPFGIERFVWYSPTNALVSRPSAMRNIIPGNFYANGLLASGLLEPSANRRLTYEFAITDGLGDDALNDRRGSRQTRDNNSSRALTGRVGYAIGNRVELGASLHHQRYASDRDLGLTFYGLDLSGRWKGWELRSEWLEATIETDEAGGLVGAVPRHDLEQQGFYLQLAYSFSWSRDLLPEFRLVSRYDDIDLDRGMSGNDDQRLLSFGLNMLVYDHFRTKLEYQFNSEDGPSRDNDTFFLQLVLDY